MKKANDDRSAQTVVLIVDDVLDNLAVLHDALDESGFMAQRPWRRRHRRSLMSFCWMPSCRGWMALRYAVA
jgi:CheY-like chemotaxis protein